MGRTYRNIKGAYNKDGSRNYKRRVAQPAVITPEWAEKMMAPHLQYALQVLVEQGVISSSEVVDYTAVVNRRVRNAAEQYDAEKRNASGKTASAMNYLMSTVENTVANIVKSLNRLRRNAVEVPISSLPPDEAAELGFVSKDDHAFSDECKSVKELILKMDLDTFVRMLTREQYIVFKMRLAGCSNEECGDALFCSRFRVAKQILPRIRKKARLCGFVPRSEVEGRK